MVEGTKKEVADMEETIDDRRVEVAIERRKKRRR